MGYATLKHQWPTPPSGPWQLLTSYFARMLISNSYWSLQNILLLDMWPDFPLHLSEFSCFYDRMPLFLIKPSYFKGECDGYLPISYSLLPHLPSWAHHPHGMPTVPFKRKLSLLQFSKQDFTPPRAVKSENPILSVYFITWRESLIFPPTVGWGFDLKLRIKEQFWHNSLLYLDQVKSALDAMCPIVLLSFGWHVQGFYCYNSIKGFT